MKKLLFAILFVLIAGMVLGACATKTDDIRIASAADPSVDFKALKTYQFIGGVGALYDPDERWAPTNLDISAKVQWYIERELKKRGLLPVNEDPDVLVVYAIALDMETIVAKYDKDKSVWFVDNVPQGAIYVSLVEPLSTEAIWLGAAGADLLENPDEKTTAKRLDYAIKKIFSTLPQ